MIIQNVEYNYTQTASLNLIFAQPSDFRTFQTPREPVFVRGITNMIKILPKRHVSGRIAVSSYS